MVKLAYENHQSNLCTQLTAHRNLDVIFSGMTCFSLFKNVFMFFYLILHALILHI